MNLLNEAIEDYSIVLILRPDDAFAFYNRGISHEKNNDLNKAISDFDWAIHLDPHQADFYYNRGFTLKKMNQLDKAIMDFSHCILIKPDHYKSFYNRGLCYEKKGNLKSAEEDFKFGVQLGMIRSLFFINLANLKIKQEDFEKALTYIENAIIEEPKNSSVFNIRGMIYEKMLFYKEALKDFNQAIQLNGNNPTYFYNRGCLYKIINE